MRVGAIALAVLVAIAGGRDAHAQTPLVRGYYQNVPLWSKSTDLLDGGASDFNRLRLMSEPTFGPFAVGVAYEQVLTVRQRPGNGGPFVGAVPRGGEWLDLEWTIGENDHAVWQHRFDRLYLDWASADSLDVRVGRQAASWATTLFLTPADPFAPFDPADPFREFRAGIDAARVQFYPAPLSQIDFVVRPTKSPLGTEYTALGRGLTTWKGWEMSGWAGSLYDDFAAAGGAAGSLGPLALRGETALRRVAGGTVLRSTIGLDRRLDVSNRDLYLVVEYQHDGFGASGAQEYVRVLEADPFARGELQVLGRDETVIQAQYEIHPLWSLSALWLWNLNDRSRLFSPSFSYSASNEMTVMGGIFLGFGDDTVGAPGALPSEYGVIGTTLYLSVSAFF